MAVLRVRFVTLKRVAAELRISYTVLLKAMTGATKVRAGLAVRAARLAGVGVSDVLEGQFPAPGQCPMCGKHEGG